jgi:hypothetical protein
LVTLPLLPRFIFLWCGAFIWKPAILPFGSRAASLPRLRLAFYPWRRSICAKKKRRCSVVVSVARGHVLFRRILQLVDYCAHISANGPGRGHLSRPASEKFPKPRCPKICPPSRCRRSIDLITIADCSEANCARAAARLFQERYRAELGKVWVQGHGGFQYYMEQWGRNLLTAKTPRRLREVFS